MYIHEHASFNAIHEFFSYINSATFVENDLFRNETDFDDSNSDEMNIDNEYLNLNNDNNQKNNKNSSISFNRVKKIDTSPEAEKKRREAFEKWLKNNNAREKEQKRLQREKLQALEREKREQEEAKKALNDERVNVWYEKKKIETRQRMAKLDEKKKKISDESKKPKEFKKKLCYDDWIAKKNEAIKALKLEKEKKTQTLIISDHDKKARSQEEFQKWLKTSKNTPRPVPLNRGLDSLRGATTKLFVNPIAWNETPSTTSINDF